MPSNYKMFPLLIEWFHAECRYLTAEEIGFFIQLILYLFTQDRPIKDYEHAGRIAHVDKRVAKRLFEKVEDKFVKNQYGCTHTLITKILRNNGKIKGLNRVAGSGGSPPQELELEYSSLATHSERDQDRSSRHATHQQNGKHKRRQRDRFAEQLFGSPDPEV